MSAESTTPRPNHYGAANDLYQLARDQLAESTREGMAGSDFAATLAMQNAQLVAGLAQTQALLAIITTLRDIEAHR